MGAMGAGGAPRGRACGLPPSTMGALLLCALLLLLLLGLGPGGGSTWLTDGDPEASDAYSDEEELYAEEEESLPVDCGSGYQDRLAVLCWPTFHATLTATAKESRCLWETIGRAYSELTVCAGLLAESLGCPTAGPALDAFFVSIHTEYFASCLLPLEATEHHLPTGTVVLLAALPVCLVPVSVALTLHRA
ncbi:receptor activity-modifying protein 1-like isoform X2 [Paroedura picta]|uniref:receptor activity-modifying protein 1-like isoform X2 n=1 Tax=Paroedura picta TaxID=143630 RepID=UPI0040562522